MQRGNNRQDCFAGELDYVTYLRLLAQVREREGCRIHAYVLMTNHVHLLVTGPRADSISRMMKRVGEAYVRYFNDTHSRSGTLWEGRFRSNVVHAANYLFTLYRYIEMNPVRAGMVAGPAQYRWSSHKANAYGDRDDLVSPHELYFALGEPEGARREAYRALFGTPETAESLEQIRDAINGGFALGSPEFIRDLEARTGRRVERLSKGRTRASNAAVRPREREKQQVSNVDNSSLTPVV